MSEQKEEMQSLIKEQFLEIVEIKDRRSGEFRKEIEKNERKEAQERYGLSGISRGAVMVGVAC